MRKEFWKWAGPLGRIPFARKKNKGSRFRRPRSTRFEPLESRVLMSVAGQIAVDGAYVTSVRYSPGGPGGRGPVGQCQLPTHRAPVELRPEEPFLGHPQGARRAGQPDGAGSRGANPGRKRDRRALGRHSGASQQHSRQGGQNRGQANNGDCLRRRCRPRPFARG